MKQKTIIILVICAALIIGAALLLFSRQRKPLSDTKGYDMRVSKIVIPAAGYGTRFLPFTKSVPKEMLPLVNKPALQNVIEEGIAAGVQSFCLIINEDKKSIPHYFAHDKKLQTALDALNKGALLTPLNTLIDNTTFTYINQPKMMGLGHAVLLAKDYCKNEYFGVILPDDIIADDASTIGEMIKIAQKHEAVVIGVQEVERHEISSYGCVKIKGPISDTLYAIEDVVEKPKPEDAPSNLAIVGRYVFSPEIFSAIEEITPLAKGEIMLTDAITLLARKGHKILAYKIKGKRFDTGRPPGWVAANVYYGLQSKEYGAQIRKEIESILRAS